MGRKGTNIPLPITRSAREGILKLNSANMGGGKFKEERKRKKTRKRRRRNREEEKRYAVQVGRREKEKEEEKEEMQTFYLRVTWAAVAAAVDASLAGWLSPLGRTRRRRKGRRRRRSRRPSFPVSVPRETKDKG